MVVGDGVSKDAAWCYPDCKEEAKQVAELLTGLFDQHCSKAGPSIPPEEFAKLSHAQICGSKIPKIGP